MQSRVTTLPQTYWCSVCEQYKTKSDFHPRKDGKKGVRSACKTCSAEQQASEKSRAYSRAYHAKRTAEDPEYRQMKRDAARNTRRKIKYGMKKGVFEALVHSQKGLCLICQGYFGLKLRVDHCHTSGQVRGLLCANCNSGIGLLQESERIFKAAARYLRKR